MRLVLGEHGYLAHSGIGKVGQDEVDQAIGAPERHCRLGSVCCQRHQPLTFAASQDDRQNLGTSCHGLNLGSAGAWRQEARKRTGGLRVEDLSSLGTAVTRFGLWLPTPLTNFESPC